MARRLLPRDRAAIHAGPKLDQGVEIGALAPDQLGDEALERVALEDRSAALVDRPQVGQDRKGGLERDRALIIRSLLWNNSYRTMVFIWNNCSTSIDSLCLVGG